jgi:hypothetical protein
MIEKVYCGFPTAYGRGWMRRHSISIYPSLIFFSTNKLAWQRSISPQNKGWRKEVWKGHTQKEKRQRAEKDMDEKALYICSSADLRR